MTDVLTLDYELPSRTEVDERRLAAAKPIELRYDYFLGDIIFVVDGLDASARWGWVPILDFALCMDTIVDALAAGPRTDEQFEFTESSARITFRRVADSIEISTTYAEGRAVVPIPDLRLAVARFLQRLSRDLGSRFTGFWQNDYVGEKLGRYRPTN